MPTTEVPADDVTLTEQVLEATHYDIQDVSPVTDNVMASIHPNNWSSHNSKFLKTRHDRRDYLMAVYHVCDDPVVHTAKVVEEAVRTYYDKGGMIPNEKFVAMSAAWHITTRFLQNWRVERAIEQDLANRSAEISVPMTHEEGVRRERNDIDLMVRGTTYQVKTGKGSESDDADVRVSADVNGTTVHYEL